MFPLCDSTLNLPKNMKRNIRLGKLWDSRVFIIKRLWFGDFGTLIKMQQKFRFAHDVKVFSGRNVKIRFFVGDR
jgi:hypothetical protein